jgi:TetR/AcrR family transcriptional regulator, cholesterol catabolism regulator
MTVYADKYKETDRELANKVFEKAGELFRTIGVRNTTMDDLARGLGISKKTLYRVIDNKADLVYFCVQLDLQQKEKEFEHIAKNTENAIEEMLLIGALVHSSLQLFHPATIYDLTKFYPEAWKLIENHKEYFAKNIIRNNLKKGIKQGYYRKDIAVELVASFNMHLSNFCITDSPKGIKPDAVYKESLSYHIHAIADKKGIEQFHQLKKKIRF